MNAEPKIVRKNAEKYRRVLGLLNCLGSKKKDRKTKKKII
jgi:hypothetical protein